MAGLTAAPLSDVEQSDAIPGTPTQTDLAGSTLRMAFENGDVGVYLVVDDDSSEAQYSISVQKYLQNGRLSYTQTPFSRRWLPKCRILKSGWDLLTTAELEDARRPAVPTTGGSHANTVLLEH